MKTLDAGPCGDLTFIAGENGRPLTKESFGNLFRKACREAGLQNRSAHGLRKAAATRAAENGATVAQLDAIFGWKGAKMATYYTEAPDDDYHSTRCTCSTNDKLTFYSLTYVQGEGARGETNKISKLIFSSGAQERPIFYSSRVGA